MDNNDIIKVILELSHSSVKEVEEKFGFHNGFLRRKFKKLSLPSPSYFSSLTKEDFTISDEQAKSIRVLYENTFGKSKTVKQISLELDISEDKIKKFIKDNKITHSSFFKEINNIESIENIEKEIEDLVKFKIRKSFEDKKNQEIKKNSENFIKWKTLFLEEFKNLCQNFLRNHEPLNLSIKKNEYKYCAVLPLQDFHWGKYSSYNEVCESNLNNYDILKRRLKASTEKLFTQLKRFGTCEVLYLTVGGDFFNIDTWNNTTTSGTPQDNQSSIANMLITGIFLMISYIDALEESGLFKKIVLVPTPGNHDRTTSISLFSSLNLYYLNKESSIISSSMIELMKQKKLDLDLAESISVHNRQYEKFGKNLLVFTHGDGPKNEEMPIIIAQEARELWGSTKYCAFFNGHFHTKLVKEHNGVFQFQASSLSGSDRWHYNKGYTTANRALNCFLFSEQDGFICELYNSVDF